ncbi:MAG: hypothetical protein ACRENP_07315, partial [Longimicrobiales bacterium]
GRARLLALATIGAAACLAFLLGRGHQPVGPCQEQPQESNQPCSTQQLGDSVTGDGDGNVSRPFTGYEFAAT